MSLGRNPQVLLHQGYTQWRDLPPVGANTPGAARSPGYVASYENTHSRAVNGGVAIRSPLAPLLVDPGARRYDRPTIGGSAAATWIQRSAPQTSAEWDRTVDEALAAQRRHGVDALLIPTIELGSGDYPHGLQRALNAARRATTRLQGNDPEALVRVIASHEWILNGSMRRVMLDQITDLPDALGVALQIRWNTHRLFADSNAVNALKRTVQILVGDGRRVLLMHSGLLGWLTTAWGVWGYTAGMSNASWHDHTVVIRRRAGQPSVPRVPRYFAAPLLASLTRAELRAAGNAAGRCRCAFCNRLQPVGTGQWDHRLAAQHGLRALAVITDPVQGHLTAREQVVRDAVEAAQARWTSLQQSEPTYLQAWLDAL